MKQYALMSKADATSGWQVNAQSESLLEIVRERERCLEIFGCSTMIAEIIDPLDAYDRANYERQQEERERRAASA